MEENTLNQVEEHYAPHFYIVPTYMLINKYFQEFVSKLQRDGEIVIVNAYGNPPPECLPGQPNCPPNQ